MFKYELERHNQTQQMQVTDLLSNFGGKWIFYNLLFLNVLIFQGLLGLYLGFSFLTFAELLDIFFGIVYLIITYTLNKRQNNQVNAECLSNSSITTVEKDNELKNFSNEKLLKIDQNSIIKID